MAAWALGQGPLGEGLQVKRGAYAELRGRRPAFRRAELAETVPEGEARQEAAPAAAQGPS